MNMRLTMILLLAVEIVRGQSPGVFTATGSMMTPSQTATLLLNGKVLIAGVFQGDDTNPSQLYDPSTGAFTATGETDGRLISTATLLPDGRVLMVELTPGNPAIDFARYAQVYDPSTGAFTATGDLVARTYGTVGRAPLLQDGRVFIAGYPTAQLYDPVSGTFAATGPYAAPAPGVMGSATLLADGRVLLTGAVNICFLAQCREPGTAWTELFDPKTGDYSLATGMKGWNNVYTATLLPSGKVLFVGNDTYNGIPPSAEVFDPSDGTFTAIRSPSASHQYGATTLLPDGTALITGGLAPGGDALAISELYLWESAMFATNSNMTTACWGHTSTLLTDGTVLIAGGISLSPYLNSFPSALVVSSAEIYHPGVLVPAPLLFSLSADGKGQGAIWHAATGEVVSTSSPAAAGDVLAMYTTSLIDGSVIPPQVSIGGRSAEILFFGGAPGYPGYYQVNFRVPRGVAGSDVSVRLMYLGRPSNEVTMEVR
jgi:hypothetical protein